MSEIKCYNEKIIELRDIDVIFGEGDNLVHALKKINLEINKGDIFGIVGFSGAGKSTLVRVMNLLQKPKSGSVIVNGVDLLSLDNTKLIEKRRKIGMIFQSFNLMPSRSVYDNVKLAMIYSNLSQSEQNDRINKLLELVELADKKNSYPSQLSGGQKQRVAIARALANEPDVLLCDEATSALDPQTTNSILKLLKSLNDKLNLTIVIITHEMHVVKQICNRVAVMELGNIVEKGDIYSVFSSPRDKVTKGFINAATHLDEAKLEVKSLYDEKKLGENEILAVLTYKNESANEPLIIEIFTKFKIQSNILFGNVEILKGRLYGTLMVVLNGDEDNLKQAISYLEKNSVNVELIE